MHAAGAPMGLLLPAATARRRRLPTHSSSPARLHHPCSAEEVRAKFERYGPIRDIYLPKDFCELR